jgi:lysophospholipase L1-like esterase
MWLLSPAIRTAAMIAAVALLGADRWVGTWEAAPAWADQNARFADQTLREVVHTSVGGNLVRVRFSNTFGELPLTIAHATIAVRDVGAIAAATPMQITVDGARRFTIPPHAQVFSDPIDLRVRPAGDLLVSMFLSGDVRSPTCHPLALQTNYVASGDHASDVSGVAFGDEYQQWYLISGVDLQASAGGSVVTLGDSITDGAHSVPNENGRWPDVLARRLLQFPPERQLGVLNAGISGNRILLDGRNFGVNAIARFDRDVVAQSGVKDVIVLLGINDIAQLPHQNDAGAIEAGLRQLAVQAHERGLRIFVATILPFEGWHTYSPAGEAAREAVNAFIRKSKTFDGFVDFDRLIRDPSDPHRMRPEYDGGDHLHPSPAGLEIMGNAIPLNKL